MAKSDYDVIIVGAGPCGACAAQAAAKEGVSTLVLERRKEIGAPVRCGEGIGLHWVDEFKMEMNPKAVSAQLNGAKLVGPAGKGIVLRTKETKGYVVDRRVFDKDLALAAGRAGAEIRMKSEVLGVLKEGSKITGVVVEKDGERETLSSKVLIAADGGESTIARMAGINSTATLYDTDFGIEYEMVNVQCEDLIEIYFTNKYAPRGYIWIFPKGKDVANVGVGIGGHKEPYAKKYLDAWIRDVGGERLAKAQPVAIKGGIIPVGAPMKGLVLDGFMVAGTAAHQVDPIHGGGISLAMDAGYIAGRSAGRCIKNGKWDKGALSSYEKEWREKREGKLLKRLKLRKVLEMLSDDDFDFLFGSLDSADCEKLLASDFSPVVKKVLAKRPSLLKVVGSLLK